MGKKQQNRVQIAVRLPKELLNETIRNARKHNRSLSAYVRIAIEEKNKVEKIPDEIKFKNWAYELITELFDERKRKFVSSSSNPSSSQYVTSR